MADSDPFAELSADELRQRLADVTDEVERLRLLFDRTRDILVLHDIKGRLLDANAFAHKRLGYEREEFLSLTVGDINPQVGAIPPEDLGKNWAAMPLDGAVPVETIMQSKDGGEIPMEVLVAPFVEKGERLFVAVGRDLTERKRAETELARGEQRFRAIFEAAPIGMLILDSRDHITEANSAIALMLGYEVGELLALTLEGITHPEDKEVGRAFREELRSGVRDHFKMEKRYLHETGETKWAQVSAFRDRDPHTGEVRIVAFLEDISERKEIERQRQEMFAQLDELVEERTSQLRSEIAERRRTENQLAEAVREAEAANLSKSQFLAGMSHELRTPLNAVIGYSELLIDDAEDEGLDGFTPDLHKIRGAGKHLLGIINDILDLSKVEAGKIELFIEPVVLEPLIREVMSTIRPLADKNENRLELVIELHGQPVPTDVTRFRQILFNLLSNACKFTESGRVSLEVYEHQLENGGWIQCAVTDTGLGIKPEELEILFKPFTQADASTSRRFGGTGLGLSISEQFARMLGGRIDVQSEYGKGSTFTFWLPTTPPVELSEGPNADPDSMPRSLDATVLVVDDDQNSRELLVRMLESEGYKVLQADSGLRGIELAEAHRPDLITLDVLMPGMDGWAVLTRLKESHELAEIPVIIVSLVRDKGIGYALGAADFINKPIDRKRLLSVMDRFRPLSGPAHVLVIDDDSEARQLVRHAAEREGWAVREADSGFSGLQSIREAPPGVVVLDLMMPEMDGFEVLETIRASESTRNLPVIVLTAKDLTLGERDLLTRKVSWVMEKASYSRADLVEHVRELIGQPQPAPAVVVEEE
jgi:PAS domain S-box-containing protein